MRNSPPMPHHFSAELRDFILRLLIKDPKKRLGARGSEEVKRHPFFKVMVSSRDFDDHSDAILNSSSVTASRNNERN